MLISKPPRGRPENRRRFLGYSAAGAAAVMLGTGSWDTIAQAEPRLSGYPFALGIASGDPAPHGGLVLWWRTGNQERSSTKGRRPDSDSNGTRSRGPMPAEGRGRR